MAELDAAAAVVVLWCELATSSTWVRKEATRARARQTYVPCWIQAATLPDPFDKAHTIDLTVWDGAPLSHTLFRLLESIGQMVGRPPKVNFNDLSELDEDWRSLGAPSLANFALGDAISQRNEPSVPRTAPSSILGRPPEGLDAKSTALWARAARGDAEALTDLALSYEVRGPESGLVQDQHEAVRLYKVAAGKGYAKAQYELARRYYYDKVGPVEDVVRLMKLAVAQGYADAQVFLGELHRDGRDGLSKDEREAVRLFRLAADQGSVRGQCLLGHMYKEGRGGLTKNDHEATRLYKLAADQNDILGSGCCDFAEMLATGRHGMQYTPQNAARMAASYYKRALIDPSWRSNFLEFDRTARATGDPFSNFVLGLFYEFGTCGLISPQTAPDYYRVAADQGYEPARIQLARLGKV